MSTAPAVTLSVIVPCFNEEQNIPSLIDHFAAALAKEPGVELLLVDNGSTDKTGSAIDRCLKDKDFGFARKITVPVNRGYGFGILAGLAEARGSVLAWTHADLQTDPEDVLRAYDLFRKETSSGKRVLIKGHRRNRKAAEKLFSFGMQLTASAALGTPLSEINAQPKLFSREFYESLKDPPHDFSLDLYLLYQAKKNGLSIAALPVYFRERKFGEAKGGSGSSWKTRWKLIKRSYAYIFELRARVRKKEKS